MHTLKFFLSSQSGITAILLGKSALIAVLGFFVLPAGANPVEDGFDPEKDRHQSLIAILETDVEISGDRQFKQAITDATNSSVEVSVFTTEESVMTTESNLPPFPLAESSAALLLPQELITPTASNHQNPLLTQVTAENTEDIPEPESENSESKTATDNPWTFKIQPYATLALSTYGSSTVRGRTVDYDLNLAELLGILKVAASGHFEAWHNNLGFIFDGYYVNLGGSGIVSFENLPNTTIESQLKVQQGIYDFAVSYRFGDTPPNRLPDQPSQRNYPLFWFEPYAGVRLNDIYAELEELTLKVGDTSIPANFDRIDETQGRTWFEPLLGGKLGIQLSDPIALWLRGDVSGFGLAGDTDLSWQVLGGIDWWVNHSISLQLGYRFYEIDYQNGSDKGAFGMNLNLNGPFVGATFYF